MTRVLQGRTGDGGDMRKNIGKTAVGPTRRVCNVSTLSLPLAMLRLSVIVWIFSATPTTAMDDQRGSQ